MLFGFYWRFVQRLPWEFSNPDFTPTSILFLPPNRYRGDRCVIHARYTELFARKICINTCPWISPTLQREKKIRCVFLSSMKSKFAVSVNSLILAVVKCFYTPALGRYFRLSARVPRAAVHRDTRLWLSPNKGSIPHITCLFPDFPTASSH